MINPLDLLPDDLGEYLGCSLFTGATYLYVGHVNSKTGKEKNKAEAAKEKIEELSRSIEKNCLSEDAINYLKKQA
ncbi:MAG: hypothetical protein H0V66_03775 [Bdellovibrionales bacterium]|nr:hypothetical protein [Bdellovibrionales bacterium]